MISRILNGYTGLGACLVAAATPLQQEHPTLACDWVFWLELVIKVLAVVLAAVTGKKLGQQVAGKDRKSK